MGKLNLRAIQVRQTGLAEHASGKRSTSPCWADVLADVPPSSVLVRNRPVQHSIVKQRVKSTPEKPTPQVVFHESLPKRLQPKKASRLFQPTKIYYEEDQLRKEFYQDHPWELARPRIVLENDGKDHTRYDWSKLQQPGKKLDGESVVQRQLYLLNTEPDMTKATAYDIARKEFYKLRLQEEVERKVAEEEARATGAYFGPRLLEKGMELENQEYERWKAWSEKESIMFTQRTNALLGVSADEPAGEEATEKETNEEGDPDTPDAIAR